MIRSYTWNGRDVTEAEFAQRVSDLMRAGWAFQDPAAARDALLAKFEALADEWTTRAMRISRNGHPFAAQLWLERADAIRAVIKEARA